MKRYFFGVAIASLLFVAACDTAQHLDEIDEAELEVVSAIVAGAMAGQSEGFLSDVYDLTANVSEEGIQPRRHGSGPDPLMRGGAQHYRATYDPDTGVHTVSFSRSVEIPNWSKSMEAILEYVYQDADGAFLQFPRRERDDIASITFNGTRNGHTHRQTPNGDQSMSTEFERTTRWYLTGLDARATHLTLEGEQSHSGAVHRVGLGDREMHRAFSMQMKTVDVSIAKPASAEEDLVDLVSGTIEYEVDVTMTVNGREQVRSHAGTIELAGDGTALLRFEGLRHVFMISLENGAVQRTR